ncbi:MAG: HlyD family secretion protein [Pseudomonadota bacterium]
MNRQNGLGKKIGMLAFLILIVAGGYGYYYWSQGFETTDDAFVDGRVYAVTPRVGGYVTDLLVDDDQLVKKDQVLLRLDPTELEVALASAKAGLAEAEATLASLELGVPLELNQTEQRVKAAEAELESLLQTLAGAKKEEEAALQALRQAEAENKMARTDYDRMKILSKNGVVAQSVLDGYETKAKTASAGSLAAAARRDHAAKTRAALESGINRLRANIVLAATGQDQAAIQGRRVEAQRARIALARSKIKEAALNLEYTELKAPADGHVTKKNVEAGRIVSKGQYLMAVVPLGPRDLWVRANFKETQLTGMTPGRRVEIKVDAFPGRKITGRVGSIMAGTGSVFSLFPPENASGNFVKVVQRIPVKIILDDDPAARPALRLGMSVEPKVFLR